MKRETIADIFYIARMFFGIGFFFTYVFATDYRSAIILTNLALWMATAIIYRLVK